MHTASKGVDIQVDKRTIDQVWEARGYVDKLRIEEAQYVEGRRRIETGQRYNTQMEKHRVNQAEANRRIEEERRRILEIEMEKRRLEQAERDRRREEEREREREREKMERDRKLRQEIKTRTEKFERIRSNGEDQLKDIKKWLDECEKKDHEKYLEVKRRYEELENIMKKPSFDDEDLERKLSNLNKLIIEAETWNMDVRELHRDQINAAEIILALIAAVVGTVGGVAGGGVGVVGGAVAGAGVGAVVGLIGGPAGILVGGAVGGAVGGVVVGAVGAVTGAVGAVAYIFGWWK